MKIAFLLATAVVEERFEDVTAKLDGLGVPLFHKSADTDH